MFGENIKVGCSFANMRVYRIHCSNRACSLGRHLVELSAIADTGSMMGSGLFKDFRTKFIPRRYMYFRTVLHTDRRNSEVFHDIYAKTGQSRFF